MSSLKDGPHLYTSQSLWLQVTEIDFSSSVEKNIYWKDTEGLQKPLMMGEPGSENEKKISMFGEPR